MRGLKLRPGSLVEVDIDVHHRGDVWYPASFIEQVNSNSFLVKLLNSKKAGHQKVVVDFSHIRPTPTHGYRKSFSLMDKVDASYDNGWWSGVVTKVFEGKRYLVCLDRTKKEKELRHTDLRLHMEWSNSDGNWFQSPVGDDEMPPVTRNKERLQRKHVLVSDIVSGTSRNDSAALPHQQNGKMSPSQSGNSGQHMKEERKKAVKKKHREASEDHDSPNNGGMQQKEGKAINRKRKRGRPPRVFSQVITPKTKEADKADVGDDLRNNKMKALDSIGVRDVETAGARTSSDVNDGDASFSGIPSPPTAGGCEETGEREDHNKKQPDGPTEEKEQVKKDDTAPEGQNGMLALSTVTAPLQIEDLPFVRISQVWKTIESMEVFKQIPQKPHFRPLYNFKEESREGMAIGNMITFANLVDRIPRLQFWDPRNLIDGYMEALSDLEAMGLNVEPVREKLNKLLAIKSREEMALNTIKEIEMQELEREREKLKLSGEISEVDEKIRELNLKKASLVSMREMKDDEIVLLQSSKDGVKRSLKGVEEEFEKVAASFR